MQKIKTYRQFELALQRADALEQKNEDGTMTRDERKEWDALSDAIVDYEDRQEERTGWRI